MGTVPTGTVPSRTADCPHRGNGDCPLRRGTVLIGTVPVPACPENRRTLEKTMRYWLSLLLLLFAFACSGKDDAARAPLVLAAASLQEGMDDAADEWADRGHERPVLSFAGSQALARQIIGGAPADIFASADEEWMDEVEQAGLISPGTRASFLGNRMVLIAPAQSDVRFALDGDSDLAGALGDGRLAMAEPETVPAGRYGKAALESLDLWTGVADRIASAENVRAALALVERGEAPLGIVYATDAFASEQVRIVAAFPRNSHPPISYPVAVLTASTSADATAFRDFLVSGEGRAIFARRGFSD